MPQVLRIVEVALAQTPCRTRLPFRFGAVTLTAAALLTCRVLARGADGRTAQGWSADLMVPRWFRKDPTRPIEADVAALHDAALGAARAAVARTATRPATPFDLWHELFAERVLALPTGAPDQLERGFGVALLERAVLDACCRLLARPFATALREDAFGFCPEAIHGDLAGWDWRAALPRPAERIALRHTVGMLDPLRTADVPAGARIADGLPQALEEDIAAYGLRWFKVKVGQGHAADRARLLSLARLFADLDLEAQLTLDGNEQFGDLGEVADLLEAVAQEPLGRALLQRLHLIEQPLARADTFRPERHREPDRRRVAAFAPLILDEADATPDSFRQALGLGYRGVSVKNCKGVFRAIANAGLCRLQPGRLQSGEDLTNLPVLPLQQDLITMACLGLPHVERNGHHYFRGLDHLPPPLAEAAAEAHPDLYRPLAPGHALRIERGELGLGSTLAAVGYGHALDGHADLLHTVAAS